MKPVARVVDINTIKTEPGTVLQEGTELFTAAPVEELLQPAEPGDFEIIPTEMTAEYLRRDRFAGEALQGFCWLTLILRGLTLQCLLVTRSGRLMRLLLSWTRPRGTVSSPRRNNPVKGFAAVSQNLSGRLFGSFLAAQK